MMGQSLKIELSRLGASYLMLCSFVGVWGVGMGRATAQPGQGAPPQQTVVVLLDDSGSMEEPMQSGAGRVRRIDAAKVALTKVLEQLPPGTRFGLLTLNSQRQDSHWLIPLAPLEGIDWRERVAEIEAQGGTPLGEFLKQGADALLAARATQPYGFYRLLIVTDGEANDPQFVSSYLPEILARGVIVDVIGVDMNGEHSLARRAHSYRRADDAAALQRAVAEVFAETAADDAAAAEGFELLAGLPDEFAVEAVKVLTQRNDKPIEGVQVTEQEWLADNPGSAPATPATAVDFAVSGLFCCLCPVVLVGLTVGGFLLIIGKRNRR